MTPRNPEIGRRAALLAGTVGLVWSFVSLLYLMNTPLLAFAWVGERLPQLNSMLVQLRTAWAVVSEALAALLRPVLSPFSWLDSARSHVEFSAGYFVAVRMLLPAMEATFERMFQAEMRNRETPGWLPMVISLLIFGGTSYLLASDQVVRWVTYSEWEALWEAPFWRHSFAFGGVTGIVVGVLAPIVGWLIKRSLARR